MDNDIKAWLFDILSAIMEIESFFIDGPKEFMKYQADIRTKRAVERNIESKSHKLHTFVAHISCSIVLLPVI